MSIKSYDYTLNVYYEAQLPLPNQSSRNMVTDCKTSTNSDEDEKGKTSTDIDDEKSRPTIHFLAFKGEAIL